MTTNDINRILGITESFQMHDVLMEALFDSEKRNRIFNEFLNIENDLSYDWFTNYFQSEHSNRSAFMQDYTPTCLCRIISGITSNHNNDVLDECSGIGGLTISEWNRNPDRMFYLEELSDNSVALLLFNLSIRGMDAIVRHGDVLTNRFKKTYRLKRNGRFSDITEIEDVDYKVGCVISNPPYSLKFEQIEHYQDDIRFSKYGTPPKSKADYAFVLNALYRLKEDGEALFILPHGVLFRGAAEEKIRKDLLRSGNIYAVIGLPDKLFLNTQIPVCILVLKKNRNTQDVLFIDASKDYVKGGKQNDMSNDQIQKIVDVYRSRMTIDKYSRLVELDEIEGNDYNLNIPRYIDSFEEVEPIDIQSSVDDLISIESEIKNTELELCSMLRNLRGPEDYMIERDRLVGTIETTDEHMISDTVKGVVNYMEDNRNDLVDQRNVNIFDVATFERSKSGKVYPKGSILIQVSATRGQLCYMEYDAPVDSKYGVFQPFGIESKYLYYILDMNMPRFLSRYQTGLNINPEIFKHLNFTIHNRIETQMMIVTIMDSMQNQIDLCENEVDTWKDIKQYHLDGMFA